MESATKQAPDVVLLDLTMPGIDGYETCRRLKGMPSLNATRVIVISGSSDAEDLQMAFDAGADDFLVKPVEPYEFVSRVKLHLRLRRTIGFSNALHKRAAEQDHRALVDIERSQEILADVLQHLAERRDNETGLHLIRMTEYAVALAEALRDDSDYADQIDDAFIADLRRACPLHDIGKVGIPDDILLKPGRLNSEEFTAMKEHTTIGASILEQAVNQMQGRGFLVMAMEIARYHHERWDGGGYPAGMSGSQIPLCARIVSVADVYDALTTKRSYKPAWTSARAWQTIDAGAHTQFDPIVVMAFQKCFSRVLTIQKSFAGEKHCTIHPIGASHRELAAAM